jgi:VanZ family protein
MNNRTQQRFIHFSRTLWLICLAFVSVGSVLPGTDHFQPIMGSDKLLHLISYAGLALLQPLFLKEERLFLRWALLLVLWGILLEGVQGLVPNRTPSFWDFIANTAGVMLGTWAGRRIKRRLYRTTPS